jgi:hypothetical protein
LNFCSPASALSNLGTFRFFLEEHGYASEEEALEVWEAETDAEGLRLLQLLIIRAYAKRFMFSISHH